MLTVRRQAHEEVQTPGCVSALDDAAGERQSRACRNDRTPFLAFNDLAEFRGLRLQPGSAGETASFGVFLH